MENRLVSEGLHPVGGRGGQVSISLPSYMAIAFPRTPVGFGKHLESGIRLLHSDSNVPFFECDHLYREQN